MARWAREYAPTFACWDVIECLHERRAERMPASLIAHVVGRSERDLAATFDLLIERGLVRRSLDGRGAALYTYDPPPRTAAELDRMFAMLPDQSVRVAMVKEVLSLAGDPGRRSPRIGFRGLFRRD